MRFITLLLAGHPFISGHFADPCWYNHTLQLHTDALIENAQRTNTEQDYKDKVLTENIIRQ